MASDLGAFPFCPERIEEPRQHDLVGSDNESGFVDARAVGEHADRRFLLSWDNAPPPLVDAIADFWDQALGTIKSMDLTPPDESALVVRFAQNAIQVRQRTANKAQVQVLMVADK